MNENICDKKINKEPLVLQSSSSKDNSHYKILQPVTSEAKNNKNNNKDNILDYKNVFFTLPGEISSAYIHRNNLKKQNQPGTPWTENAEDDDEQFLLNMKKNIDENYKMQKKENYNIRDLQSKSYLSRKKKSVFSDENQNLIKRFKKSIDENKALCVVPPELQQSENITSINNQNNSTTTNTLQIIPTPALNNIDMNLRNNMDQFFFHVTSEMQKSDQSITPMNKKIVTETEIEQLIYYEKCFTPPQKDD